MSGFADSVKSLFDGLKRKTPRTPWTLLPVFDEQKKQMGWLRPITADYRTVDPELSARLSGWLKENPIISTGTFEVTVERTERWLDNLVIGRPDRMLFVIQDLAGQAVGYLGLSNLRAEQRCCSIDSVLRGEKTAPKGIMRFAVITLLDWAFESLDFANIDLYVYADNEHAIRFYEALAYVRGEKLPLVRVQYEKETKWELAPAGTTEAERYYLHMDLNREEYQKRYSQGAIQ